MLLHSAPRYSGSVECLSRCKVLGQMAKRFRFKCWDMNWEMGQPDPLPHGINLGINLHPSSQVSCCCILPMATQLVRSLWTDARCRVSWPYATIWAWKCNAVCNIWLAWNPLWRYLMLQFSHSLNPMARQNNFILVSHSYCSHLCMLHSSQAELQRKKSELTNYLLCFWVPSIIIVAHYTMNNIHIACMVVYTGEYIEFISARLWLKQSWADGGCLPFVTGVLCM